MEWLKRFARRRPVTTIVIVLVGIIALGGFAFEKSTDRAIDAAKEEVAKEAEARATAVEEATKKVNREICENSNEARVASQNAFDRLIAIAIGGQTPDTPEAQQRLDEFMNLFQTEVLRPLDPVDCDLVVTAAMRVAQRAYEAELIAQQREDSG